MADKISGTASKKSNETPNAHEQVVRDLNDLLKRPVLDLIARAAGMRVAAVQEIAANNRPPTAMEAEGLEKAIGCLKRQ